MPNGGRLEVRTEAADGWVRLSVQDNGEGIPEELQGRIFDAFYTTKERGTGLGLAMVRQIVEGFGGRVEVSSRRGEGARFDVWLPRESV
jgi:signal transduction histidine kinase